MYEIENEIDEIFEKIDGLEIENNFEQIDAILADIDIDHTSLTLLIAYISITKCVKDKLKIEMLSLKESTIN